MIKTPRDAYYEPIFKALKAYDEDRSPAARKTYLKAMDQAWKTYDKIIDRATKVYVETKNQAWKIYREAEG